MPLVWAMGPISGTDNLMHVQQINGGSVITLENGALFRPYRLDTATESWQCNAASDGALYANTNLHTIRHCDGTNWVSLGTGAGTVSGTGTANVLTKFTAASTISDAAPLTSTDTVATDNSTNFLRITGTLPAVPSAAVAGIQATITSAGSAAQSQYGLNLNLAAGYTGASFSAGANVSNSANNTNNAGGIFHSNTGTNRFPLIATFGSGAPAPSGAAAAGAGLYIEMAGVVTKAIAVESSGVDIFSVDRDGNLKLRDIFEIRAGGDFLLSRTMTAAGTTGAQVIDKPAGSVNFAAGATTLVVTNSLAATTSGILLTAMTADTVCTSFRAVRGAGSFTITTNGACNAETAVYFEVRN